MPWYSLKSLLLRGSILLITIMILISSRSVFAQFYTASGSPPITILAAPNIEATYNGNPLVSYQIISANPVIDIYMYSSDGLDPTTFVLLLNGSPDVTSQITTIESTSDTYEVWYAPTLSAGTYDVQVQVNNALSPPETTTRTFLGLSVSNTPAIAGTPMNYPNPFKPKSNQSTTIKYYLSTDMATKIYIFETNGRLIWQRAYAAGSNGGLAGANYVTWDGKTDFQEYASNGAYIFFILSRGKVLGSGAMSVYD